MESDYITQDFEKLLAGIQELLPISLQCKLDRHYRWAYNISIFLSFMNHFNIVMCQAHPTLVKRVQ